jgi:hypothetical protein
MCLFYFGVKKENGEERREREGSSGLVREGRSRYNQNSRATLTIMTAISIRPITDETGNQHYRASAGETHSTGQTPGEALDAIVAQTGQLGQEFFLLTPNFQPDRFFTAHQQQRLATLMQAWRNALDQSQPFPEDLKLELDALVEAELLASTDRLIALNSIKAA